MDPLQAASLGWPSSPGFTTPVIKRVIRLDVPLEKFPNVSTDTCYHLFVCLNFPFGFIFLIQKHDSSILLVGFWDLVEIL